MPGLVFVQFGNEFVFISLNSDNLIKSTRYLMCCSLVYSVCMETTKFPVLLITGYDQLIHILYFLFVFLFRSIFQIQKEQNGSTR